MPRIVEGIYRDGRVDLVEPANGAEDGSRVVVTWLPVEPGSDLRERGLDAVRAADLRHRLSTFADDWDQPEMNAYDELPPR